MACFYKIIIFQIGLFGGMEHNIDPSVFASSFFGIIGGNGFGFTKSHGRYP